MSVTMSVLLVTSMLPALVGRVGASSATDSSAQDEECGAVSKYAGWRGDARAQYNLGLCALSEALALDSQEGETSGELLPNLTLPTAQLRAKPPVVVAVGRAIKIYIRTKSAFALLVFSLLR